MEAIFVRRPVAASCTIRDRLMQLMHGVLQRPFGAGAAPKKSLRMRLETTQKACKELVFFFTNQGVATVTNGHTTLL
jgi:hypothetical protein